MTPNDRSDLVVIDAPFAALWILASPESSSALDLAAQWARQSVQAIAPASILVDLTARIDEQVRRQVLTVTQAHEALEVLFDFGIRLEETPELHHRALDLTQALNLPRSRAAHYLALAESRDCEVWTGDEELYQLIQSQFPRLRWVGSFRSSAAEQPRLI